MRDLSHVSEEDLLRQAVVGNAPSDPRGRKLILHHLWQDVDGPIVEIPAPNHSIANPIQHPFGNEPGMGLTALERAAFNAWRTDSWRARAMGELAWRGL